MFESDCPEFVIPEALFTWRLNSIEEASGRTRHQNEISVVAFFAPEETARGRSRANREDQEMQAYVAKVMKRHPNSEREPDEHLLSSGFGTLEVQWESEGSISTISPWEVTLQDKAYETPSPPSLSEAASLAIAKALAKVEALPNVEEYFLHPVDESRYSDYRNRVEVPMNFSFIKERLAAGYYSNVHSVLSDAMLIRDNCLKYNGPSELSQSASDVYESFVDEVKKHVDVDEPPVYDSSQLLAGASSEGPDASNDSSRASRVARRQRQGTTTTTTRASLRSGSADGGTSLERLPMPDQRTSLSRSTRARRSSASVQQNAQPNRRRSTRSDTPSRSVLAVDREDDVGGDEEEDDDAEAYHDDGGDDEDSESMSAEDVAPRRSSRRQAAQKAGRGGNSRAASVSSSDEWDGQNRASEHEDDSESDDSPLATRRTARLKRYSRREQSEEEDEEPSDSGNSPLPTRRAARLTGRESRQERRTSPRSRRATRTSLESSPDSPARRSNRRHEAVSMADLSHSDIDEADAERETDEEPEKEVVVPRRGNAKRRSGE